MIDIQSKNVAVIVAHPDDETLWAGGTILNHTKWKCFIITVCRESDADRAPKFYRALKIYHSVGAMGDLDDGPEQTPIDQKELDLNYSQKQKNARQIYQYSIDYQYICSVQALALWTKIKQKKIKTKIIIKLLFLVCQIVAVRKWK